MLNKMEVRVSTTENKEQIINRQHNAYNHLTSSQFIERLEALIEKTNSTKDLDPRSATDILLDDRKYYDF
jgi:hypothetical protein